MVISADQLNTEQAFLKTQRAHSGSVSSGRFPAMICTYFPVSPRVRGKVMPSLWGGLAAEVGRLLSELSSELSRYCAAETAFGTPVPTEQPDSIADTAIMGTAQETDW